MVMLLNDQRVDGIQAELRPYAHGEKIQHLCKIQFLQENSKTREVIGELKLDRQHTWTLICHLLRNFSTYFFPSVECTNCNRTLPLNDVNCLCKDCTKTPEDKDG